MNTVGNKYHKIWKINPEEGLQRLYNRLENKLKPLSVIKTC
jgi:hypothetical protein